MSIYVPRQSYQIKASISLLLSEITHPKFWKALLRGISISAESESIRNANSCMDNQTQNILAILLRRMSCRHVSDMYNSFSRIYTFLLNFISIFVYIKILS